MTFLLAPIRRSVHVKVRGLRGGNQREPPHIPSQQEVLRSGVTREQTRVSQIYLIFSLTQTLTRF